MQIHFLTCLCILASSKDTGRQHSRSNFINIHRSQLTIHSGALKRQWRKETDTRCWITIKLNEACRRTFASIHDKQKRKRGEYLCQDGETKARDCTWMFNAPLLETEREKQTLIAFNAATVIVGGVDVAASCSRNLSLIDAIPFAVATTSIPLFEDTGASLDAFYGRIPRNRRTVHIQKIISRWIAIWKWNIN